MAKKDKKRKKKDRNHKQHHQAIHEYIMQQIEDEDKPPEAHVIPTRQPWHAPSKACWCRPVLKDENPLNGGTVWVHSNIIH